MMPIQWSLGPPGSLIHSGSEILLVSSMSLRPESENPTMVASPSGGTVSGPNNKGRISGSWCVNGQHLVY